MAWTIKFKSEARKQWLKLDNSIKRQIDKFILKLEKSENPRKLGEALKANFKCFWRYRIGDYRLICDINDDTISIVILRIAHRKDVYKKDL